MGKHTRSFFGFTPTGNTIKDEATLVFTIGEDAKITEHKVIRDDLALMFQLGLVKAVSPQYDEFLQTWKGVESENELSAQVQFFSKF